MEPATEHKKIIFFLSALHSLWKLGSPSQGVEPTPSALEASTTRERPADNFGWDGETCDMTVMPKKL